MEFYLSIAPILSIKENAEKRLIKVFAGYDPREAIGFSVFVRSLLEYASVPVEIIPLSGPQRDGTNAFIYQRFLTPSLCGFKGTAIFLDASDMLMRADIAELAALADPFKAVQVVKHDYKTKHPRKYVGTALEADNRSYARKNWSSAIIWNCGHYANRFLTPENVAEATGADLHRFAHLPDGLIGELPAEWNHLVGEQKCDNPKIVHFTLGIPAMAHYQDCDFAREWRHILYKMHNPELSTARKLAA